MYELQELRAKIEAKDYQGALAIIDELEEMSKDDKLNKIYSYLVVLLIHLIKQNAEDRSTISWERSIKNSLKYIKKTNKRRRFGGYYASTNEILEMLDEAYEDALDEAAYEAFGGAYDRDEFNNMVRENVIKKQAIALIRDSY
ncbi:DUF29 family protein [Myxosarcina sp. GI1]|uniref:DUF29 family protein n=1 Tax=Myxosarcina sp. GI1 TaxID=1541065 RepID=UPI0005688443|nr:DUF29 family protein [Myxosarcina sp. GI1]